MIDVLRYVGALLLVGGLMAFALFGVKRFGVPGFTKPDRKRRIRIVEILMLSPRQRLALVRRDDVEHLIVLGPEGATVIEKGIAVPPSVAADGKEPTA
jgi:flagellar protein FliO/FliZ